MIIIWILSIIISTAICWVGLKQDRALTGFALGFFLGPLGCIIALFLRMHWSASAARQEQLDAQQKQTELLQQLINGTAPDELDQHLAALQNAYGEHKK